MECYWGLSAIRRVLDSSSILVSLNGTRLRNGPNGILSTADGAKHTLTTDISNLVPNAPPPNNLTYSCANQICLYNSTDSSYINVSRPLGTFDGSVCSGPNNCPAKDSTVTYKNGTTALYQSFAVVTNDIFDEFVMRPYRITDSNGNFITISYTNPSDLSISSVTDSVGRTLNFFYSSNAGTCGGGGACAVGALLSCVTDGTSCAAPGARTYTFSWDPSHAVNFNFTLPGQLLVGGNLQSINSGFTTAVLTKVCRPDGTCAKFNYGDFAIVNDIQELSANGATVRYELNYDFPAASAGALTLNPTFTHQQEVVNGQTNTWTYSAITDANGLISSSTIIDPVGLATTTTYSRKGDWQDGLPIQVQMQDANAFHTQQLCVPTPCPQPSLKVRNITWASDLSMAQSGITNGGTPTGNNPRASSITTVLDDNSQSQVRLQYDNSATPIAAGAPAPFTGSGSIIDKVETDFGAGAPGPVLRETVTAYTSLGNHILGLPTDIKVKDGSGKVASHTVMAYDGAGVQNVSPLPGGHDNIGYSSTSSAPRGNLTSSTAYPDPAVNTGGISTTYGYDMLGNRITQQAGCCTTMAWNYSSTTQFAYPDAVVTGPSGSQLTTAYTYNQNTGQIASMTDWNGKSTTYIYDTAGRLTSSQGPDSLTVSTTYDDNSANPGMSTSSSANSLVNTHVADFTGHTLADQVLNSTSLVSTVTQVNDGKGRPVQRSNPYAPSETALYTSYAYDLLGRTTQTIPPAVLAGGTQIPYSTTMTGQVTVSTDPANHQTRQFTNALGQIVRVDQPGPSGGVVASAVATLSGTEQSVASNSSSNGATAGTANITITPTAPCSSAMQDRCVTLLTHPATPASATVTIGGSNTTNGRSSTACTGGPPSRLPLRCHTTSSTFADSGTITLTVNAGGITVGPVSINYDGSSSQTGLAGALAAALPANGAVAVSYGGGTSFTLTTKAVGSATNASTVLTSVATGCVSSSTDDGSGNSSSTNCAGPGWTATPNQNFAGGSDNGNTTFNDTGNLTVSFVVPGISPSPSIQVSETVPYGQNDSSATLVQALATKFSSDSNATQFVTASAAGGQLTMVTRATGNGTNYSISVSSATNSPNFPAGSTSFQLSGPATFVPGQPGTLYDAGTITATLKGLGSGTPPTETVNYSQGSTTAALAASLVAKINADFKWQAVTAGVANGSSTITFSASSQGAFANQFSITMAGASSFPASFPVSSFASPVETAQLANGADPSFSLTMPITTTYSYDPYDRVLQVNSGQQTQKYVYDGLGRMTSAATPESGGLPVAYTYKDFGAIATKTDPRMLPGTGTALATTYTYDALNRVTNVAYNDNVTPAIQFTYNPPNSANNTGGRLASTSNGVETKAYQYDVMGRITQCLETIGANTYTVRYNYGANGQLASITYPSLLKVSYAYDPIGRLKQLGTASQNILSINSSDYNAAGSPLTVTYGNGVIGKFGYNSQLQRSSIQYAGPSPATPLLSLTYSYGGNADNGQIQQITDSVTSARSTSYQYDPLGRLQTAQTVDQTSANTWKLSYSYDNYGNRLNQTPTGGTGAMPASSTPVDPATNRILGFGVIYDAVGNMISDGLNNYAFDANSNLTSTSRCTRLWGRTRNLCLWPGRKPGQ